MTVAIRRQRGFTLIELLIVIVILAIIFAIVIPMFLSQRDKARNANTRGGVHQIEVGVMSYAVDNGGVFPTAVDSAADLVDSHGESYVDPWPTNPWSDTPMKSDPSARGDYTYTAANNSFTLSGHLSTGEFVVP
jgi:general secretion pathway protein G